ncbi:MAG: hypothetical protein HFF04_08370 [Oscillospiraceae bacterium]|nr:hypothetical protein [Oscillospiraceae bacterium]
MAYTHLTPGVELEVSGHIYRSENKTEVAELVALSMEELKQLEQESMEKEEKIYQSICALLPDWTKQAGETVAVRKAMEYLRIQPVNHTSNQWSAGEYGVHEISNMVYKMSWRVYERTRWSRVTQRSEVETWELSWHLYFNTVQRPDNTRSGLRIAGQERKAFKDKAAMDKYLQGRIAAYAHLFTEISPLIPKGEEGRFSVNGVLLPGYSVETTVDDLLALLDEDDGMEIQPKKPRPPQEKPVIHKGKKHTLTR